MICNGMCEIWSTSVPQTEGQPCEYYNVPGQILMLLYFFGIKLYTRKTYAITLKCCITSSHHGVGGGGNGLWRWWWS
jgi:hypothetical protein